jgi:hypothetical protein
MNKISILIIPQSDENADWIKNVNPEAKKKDLHIHKVLGKIYRKKLKNA